MEICANCAAKLDPSWKFCIKCGTRVSTDVTPQPRNEPSAAGAHAPAATPEVARAEAATPEAAPTDAAASSTPLPRPRVNRRVRVVSPQTTPTPAQATESAAATAAAATTAASESAAPTNAAPGEAAAATEPSAAQRPRRAQSEFPSPTASVPPALQPEVAARTIQPQTRAEAKAAERAGTRSRNATAANAEYHTTNAVPSPSPDRADEIPAAFRSTDPLPTARKVNVPLIVSISVGVAGVVLIVYLAILVFGARG